MGACGCCGLYVFHKAVATRPAYCGSILEGRARAEVGGLNIEEEGGVVEEERGQVVG
jgi:hypothetical protein